MNWNRKVKKIDKMLNGYISYLKKSKQGANEPGANHTVREESAPYSTEPFEDSKDSVDTTL